MMKVRVSHSDAAARLTEVLRAITSSEEWKRHSPSLRGSSWDEAREPFRRFFDVYEGRDGTDWLGIMESAVVDEIRTLGADLTAEPTTIDRIIAWMAAHPNIEMLD
ncbi:hypothetical protein [Sphingomonas oryzagri]